MKPVSERDFTMPNDTRIYYLRNDQKVVLNPLNGEYSLMRGDPIVCIVSKRDCDNGSIKYGYAVLHPKENIANFSKAEGIAEATRKLNENPLEVQSRATTGHEINRNIIQHFSQSVGKKSGTVWKLTRKWL